MKTTLILFIPEYVMAKNIATNIEVSFFKFKHQVHFHRFANCHNFLSSEISNK